MNRHVHLVSFLRKMIRKHSAKGSSKDTAPPRSSTAARLADYRGAQSAPLAGYGITTVPGLYHTMSASPGSPGLEGATGGFSASDPEDGATAGVSALGFHHKEPKEVKVSALVRRGTLTQGRTAVCVRK